MSLLFIEWRLCFDEVDWLFLFVSCFLIGSFSWLLIGDFWLVRFPDCWLVDDGTHFNPSTTRLYLKKPKTAYSSRSTWVHSMCYSIFSFMCMFCRSLFVLCTFSFGHCVSVIIRFTDSDYFKLFLVVTEIKKNGTRILKSIWFNDLDKM